MGFLPDNYRTVAETKTSGEKDQRYIEFNKALEDGQSLTLRPCGTFQSGHVIAGFYYFTDQGRPRRFPVFPDNYLDDIGLTFDGKKRGTGEKDTPKYFLSFVALCKERDDFCIVTVPQLKIREQIERILGMEDYAMEDGAMAAFSLTVTRAGKDKDTTYQVIPTLKAPTKALQERWAQVSAGIWLPALYEGADPFAGKPATGKTAGLPPTARDELGADQELVQAAPTDW